LYDLKTAPGVEAMGDGLKAKVTEFLGNISLEHSPGGVGFKQPEEGG
jgi:hypothetical protein